MTLELQNVITLPVSVGEAIDKLTLLDINMDMNEDASKDAVAKEYKILREKLNDLINKYQFDYNILKDINLNIWLMQDALKSSDNENIQTQILKKIIIDSDRRSIVKQKISNRANTYFKEMRVHKLKEAFVLTHLGLGDNIHAIGMIRYLSTCFDKIYVVCKQRNSVNMKVIYSDDCSIELYAIEKVQSQFSSSIFPAVFKSRLARSSKSFTFFLSIGSLFMIPDLSSSSMFT